MFSGNGVASAMPFLRLCGLSQLSAEGAKQRTTRYAGARRKLYKKTPFRYNGVVQATTIQ